MYDVTNMSYCQIAGLERHFYIVAVNGERSVEVLSFRLDVLKIHYFVNLIHLLVVSAP